MFSSHKTFTQPSTTVQKTQTTRRYMRKVKREGRWRRRRSSKMCSSDSDNLLAPGSQAQMCCWDMTRIHWRIALPLLSFRSLISFIYQLRLEFYFYFLVRLISLLKQIVLLYTGYHITIPSSTTNPQ